MNMKYANKYARLGANLRYFKVRCESCQAQEKNMYAARRCDGCEKMQTVTNTVLGSQSFTSSDKRQSSPHPNFLLLAAWCTACRLSDCELSTRENLCVVQGINFGKSACGPC